MKKTALIAICFSFFCIVNFAWGETDFQNITKLAKNGDIMAQFFLAGKYYYGYGVPKNYSEAMKWYRKAANQGYADAQRSLGRMYHLGQGVPQNYAEAMKWYKKAADQGNVLAQARLGDMYYFGYGVPHNYVEAAKCYRKAAYQGDVMAQRLLGSMYRLGQGVPQNFFKAYVWLYIALAYGSEHCTEDLGILSSQMTPQQIAQAQKEGAELYSRIIESNELME